MRIYKGDFIESSFHQYCETAYMEVLNGIYDDYEKLQVGGHNPGLEELMEKYEENMVYRYICIYIGNVYRGLL